MPLFEVVFKVTHDCPFGNISRKFPSLKMFEWCNREHEILEVIVEDHEEYAAVMKEISKLEGIIGKSSDRDKVHLVMKTCYCSLENSVTRNIDACNLLHVAPVIYEQGWEYLRVIAFKHEDLEELLQRLDERGFEFEILRKVPFDGFIASSLTLTADALFSDLTAKQIGALLTAYKNGYYRLPRKADVTEIAFKERVPRTTFQEHLKKAENKLIAALVPYIQLFNHAPLEKRQSLKIGQEYQR
jgi:predicted DNA binding protein